MGAPPDRRGASALSEQLRCSICDRPAERRALAGCVECGGWFHLALRADLGVNCGAPLISENCGVSVACEPCIGRIEAAGGAAARVRVP
jgi:hypothetical protein